MLLIERKYLTQNRGLFETYDYEIVLPKCSVEQWNALFSKRTNANLNFKAEMANDFFYHALNTNYSSGSSATTVHSVHIYLRHRI